MVIKLSKIEGRNNAFIEMAGHVVIYCTYAFVGVKAILGFITVGSILKYISALQQFFTAFSDIVRVSSQITHMTQYMSYYCNFMEIKSEKYQCMGPYLGIRNL